MSDQVQITSPVATEDEAVIGLADGDYVVFTENGFDVDSTDVIAGSPQSLDQISSNGDFSTIVAVPLNADPELILVYDTPNGVDFQTRTDGNYSAPAQIPNATEAVSSAAGIPLADGGAFFAFVLPDNRVYWTEYSSGVFSSLSAVYSGGSDGADTTVDAATLSNGNVIVTWNAESSGASTFYGAILTQGSSSFSTPIALSPAGVEPTDPGVAALTGGGFAVVWVAEAAGGSDIETQVFDSSGAAVSSLTLVDTHPNTNANSIAETNPEIVGLNDGGYLIVWQGARASGALAQDIYGQQYDASGNAVGSNFVINQDTDVDHSLTTDGHNSVALLSASGPSQVVVSWEDASGLTIYARELTIHAPPSGANESATLGQGETHTFATDDFSFSDPDGDSFNGIVVTSLPSAGTLTDNGVAVAQGTFISASDIANGLVQFTANYTNFSSNDVFSFQIQDTGGTAEGSVDTSTSSYTYTFVNSAAGETANYNIVTIGGPWLTAAGIVGANSAGVAYGSDDTAEFVYSGGVLTSVAISGAVTGVDSVGDIVGFLAPSTVVTGFIDSGGVYTNVVLGSGAFTAITGVTPSGDVFGNYLDLRGTLHGFEDVDGIVTTIDVAALFGSDGGTTITSVNAEGYYYGEYGGDKSGAFYDDKGTLRALASNYYVTGIDAAGDAVGSYEDGATYHGFIDHDGAITTIDPAGSTSTYVTAVNDSGVVVGYYLDSDNRERGFVDQDGVISTLNISSVGTKLVGIDDFGDIFGDWFDSSGKVVPFEGSISDSGGSVTVSVAVFEDDEGGLDELSGGFAVSDSAANVSAGFDALNADDHVTAITLTGSGTPALTLTVAQALNDTRALGEIAGPYKVAISDKAQNIGNVGNFAGAIDALNGDASVSTITISDSLAVSVAGSQLITDATAIGELKNADGSPGQLSVGLITNSAQLAAAYTDFQSDQIGGINGITFALSVNQAETYISSILSRDKLPTGYSISDNAADIEAGLSTLWNGDSGWAALGGVAFTVTSGVVTVDVSSFDTYETMLGGIEGGYAVSDTVANVTSALSALASGAGLDVSSITATDGTVTVSAATFAADEAALDKIVGGFAISDKVAGITPALSSLTSDASRIASITASDGTVTVTTATFAADQAALDKIVGGFAISDTAAHVASALAALAANAKITSITATGGAVTVSTATFTAEKAALDKIAGGFAVSDGAAQVIAALDALEADVSHIKSIDATGDRVDISIATFTTDEAALNKIAGGFDVADSAADVKIALSALTADASRLGAITVSDGPLTVSTAQFGVDRGALDKITGGFAISDTAANVSTALNALNGDTHVTAIKISDSATVSVTAGQLTSDATAIGKLANANGKPYQLAVSGTAASIVTALATIQSDLSHIASVTVTAGAVSVSTAQFSADRGALDKIGGGFTIADSAANISAALNALNGDTRVTAIKISDNAAVSVTIGQLSSDATALGKLANANGKPYQLAVSGTWASIVAALSTIESDLSHIASVSIMSGAANVSTTQFSTYRGALDKIAGGFAISDSATNIGAALDALDSDANIKTITISDSQAVIVSPEQLTSDASAIGKLTNANKTPYQLIVASNTGADDIAALPVIEKDLSHIELIAPGPLTVSVAQVKNYQGALLKIDFGYNVSDTTADIDAGLSTLYDSGHNDIHAIAVTSGVVAVNVSTFSAYRSILDLISGGFAVSDSDAHVTTALAALEADAAHIKSITTTGGKVDISIATFNIDKAALNKIVGGFDVADSAADIKTALAALTADAGNVSAITVSDGPLAATAAQFAADETLLNKIGGGFGIADLAANVGAHLDALEADQAHIKTIAFTNAVTPALQVTAAQAKADASILGKITGRYALATHETDGSWDIVGHGEAVTIADIKGVDTINGGGTSDLFVFNAAFGRASILDGASHWSGVGHDTIELAKSEFANFATVLSDASVAQGHVVISAENGDKLTLDGFTSLAQLHAASADFKFV